MNDKLIKTIQNNKKIIIITLMILIIFFLIIYKNVIEKDKDIEEEILINTNLENASQAIESYIEYIEPKKIKIDIKGEVNNPGVYELNEGDRVIDAINISGGLTNKADTTLINQSKNITDEMVIIIYNKDKIAELKTEKVKTETIVKYIEKECICPDIINDACIKDYEDETPKESDDKTSEKISINTASLEQLITIPGIGNTKAQSIIEYRENNGLFKSIEEIMNIKGIGESTFEKLKNYITI